MTTDNTEADENDEGEDDGRRKFGVLSGTETVEKTRKALGDAESVDSDGDEDTDEGTDTNE